MKNKYIKIGKIIETMEYSIVSEVQDKNPGKFIDYRCSQYSPYEEDQANTICLGINFVLLGEKFKFLSKNNTQFWTGYANFYKFALDFIGWGRIHPNEIKYILGFEEEFNIYYLFNLTTKRVVRLNKETAMSLWKGKKPLSLKRDEEAWKRKKRRV